MLTRERSLVAIRQINADSAVAPNLVPMVDVMFLLLLFLMVGADMGDRQLEEVRLPVAKTAVEDPKIDTERPENVRVLIRADQAALFEHVQTAMASCAEAKIFKVELGAATMAVE